MKLVNKKMIGCLLIAFSGMVVGCTSEKVTDSSATTAVSEEMTVAPVEAEPPVDPLEAAISSEWRISPERDVWRNPQRTLSFFGLEPGMTVVEISPGGGWYTSILAPYLKATDGKLIVAGPDPASSEYAANRVAKFDEVFVSRPDVYGDIEVTISSKDAQSIADAEVADMVLSFRNVHSWMGREYADSVFMNAFNALKPGGVFGIVEHRLPSAMEQDPRAASGYVAESLVIQMATEAGFQFDGASEVNANPNDTADHPYGVWTLPPVSRTAPT